MLSRQNLLIIAIAILGALLGLYAGTYFGQPRLSAPGATLGPGEHLTDLQLPDVSGQQHRLHEWDGKLVLVNFWATWCGPCREEMPLLDRTRHELSAKGLEIIGVAIDDSAAVGAFLKDSPVKYPILVGGDTDTLYRFGDTGGVLPYSVLFAPGGKVLAQRVGSFSEHGLNRWLEPHLSR
jgi:thiol-disulfide isomerase/thioredoxin